MGDLSRPDQESGRRTMDVTGTAWRISSYSGDKAEPASRSVVRPRRGNPRQQPPRRPQLAFAPATWKTFTEQVKAAGPA